MKTKKKTKKISDYVSRNVFDGIRVMTPEQSERYKDRLRKTLERRKIDLR